MTKKEARAELLSWDCYKSATVPAFVALLDLLTDKYHVPPEAALGVLSESYNLVANEYGE